MESGNTERAKSTRSCTTYGVRKAFDEGLITDYTDVRYHNQRFLKAAGTPGHKDEVDGLVMAAFATARIHRAPAAGA